jgi:hypothetical protein
MKNNIKFSCAIDTTDNSAGLGMEIWLDQQQIFNQDCISGPQSFSYSFSDNEAEHELQFVMKHKKAEHTKIDTDGKILKDACLIVTDLAFDDIDIGQPVANNAIYTHDFNGTSNTVHNKFYGEMGCNGVVSLQFTTPFYIWLLENL